MLLSDIVATSLAVKATSKRKQKIGLLADCLRRAASDGGAGDDAAPSSAALCVAFLCGELRQGKLGIGYRTLAASRPSSAAETGTLRLRELDAELEAIQATSGKGSKGEKERRLHALLSRATRDEQTFLFHLLTGELRQGALEAVLLEAVAEATGIDAGDLRRAWMLAGDLREVATAALTEGGPGLERFRLQLFQPLRPMLAQTAESPEQAFEKLAAPCFETKLDGARVQLHKQGGEVRVYTRKLNEVTASVPELVSAVRALPAERLILDGEAIAWGKDGRPLPFQVTMRRFGRKLNVEAERAKLPLSACVFDALHWNGRDLIDVPYAERLELLDGALGSDAAVLRPVERLVGGDTAAVDDFMRRALDQGYEGVMAKDLTAGYEAGRRGAAWLKLKPAHTLDLAVLAAEWGSGRRQGYLSNLHLGARDPATDSFVMLGKTFKGMTDELLRYQTRALQERELYRDDYTVYVRPELVVEVAFDGLQESPHYPGGLALRFARVRRYRDDKTAAQADTIDTVRALYARGHRS